VIAPVSRIRKAPHRGAFLFQQLFQRKGAKTQRPQSFLFFCRSGFSREYPLNFVITCDLALVSLLLGELLFFQQLKKSNQKKAARSARATHTLSHLPCHGSS
jgi:hypothetical protein